MFAHTNGTSHSICALLSLQLDVFTVDGAGRRILNVGEHKLTLKAEGGPDQVRQRARVPALRVPSRYRCCSLCVLLSLVRTR